MSSAQIDTAPHLVQQQKQQQQQQQENINNVEHNHTHDQAIISLSKTCTSTTPENNLDIINDMIELTANHLEGLRTQCATSATLTQQEIRSLESKLVRYFSELLLTKARQSERIPACGLPHTTTDELKQWLRVVGLSQESSNICQMRITTLEQLLEQSDDELKQILANNPCYREEEVRRLTKAVHNLRNCKELLSKSNRDILSNNEIQQNADCWFWDSWDRHHHVHRGSISNIGCPTAVSPRAHHRQHSKQNAAGFKALTKSGRQSPLVSNEQQQQQHQQYQLQQQHILSNNKQDDSAHNMQNLTLTLTPTPSPPNSPFTPLSGSGYFNSYRNTPQRNKSSNLSCGTPPPIKKHQTLLNNVTPTHVLYNIPDGTTQLDTTSEVNNEMNATQSNAIALGTPRHQFYPQRIRLPAPDPSPDSYSIASSDIFIEHNNNSNVLLVPCSPGATVHVGMSHAISHRFTKVLKIMSTCNLCQKQMFIGLKCKDCKYRCHKDCEPNVPPSCGLPREYVDEFKQSFIPEQGFGPLTHTNVSTGNCSPSFKKSTLSKPRHHGDSSSPSSSCTSSTPSSPALFQLQQHQLNLSNFIPSGAGSGGGGGGNSMLCSSAGGSSTSSNLLPTPLAFHKHQTSQFNFPDVTITTSSANTATLGGNSNTNCNSITATVINELTKSSSQQSISIAALTSSLSGGTTNNGNTINLNANNDEQQHQVQQQQYPVKAPAANTATIISETFYPRKISSAGAEKRAPFTVDMSDTHKSNDSDKTVSLSGSTSTSTDSDRTPVRLDSTEDGDSGQWPRQNSLSLQEWDIPYDDLRLLEQIGKGRFGTVHRAHWHGDVAVKLLKEDYLDDHDALDAFKLEVANFKKTRHENLVLFMGACMNPPYLAIVTSLCKGNTLYTYIHQRREKFAINRTLLIAQQIAQGMGYLHARDIVHKDLRTKNIFIENGKAIITDFGLFSSTKLFYCDIGLGIPHNWLCYIAPELIRALMPRKPTDECLKFTCGSDVYSFGTVWYELICGEFTFKDQPAESIIWQVGRGMKQTLANLQSGRDVKDLLMLCWSFQVDDRPDFARLLQLLDHLPKKRLARSPSHPVNVSRSAESVF